MGHSPGVPSSPIEPNSLGPGATVPKLREQSVSSRATHLIFLTSHFAVPGRQEGAVEGIKQDAGAGEGLSDRPGAAH